MENHLAEAQAIVRALTRVRRAHDEETLVAASLEAARTVLDAPLAVLHLAGPGGGTLFWRDPDSEGLLQSDSGPPPPGSALLLCREGRGAVVVEREPEGPGPLAGRRAAAACLRFEDEDLGALAVQAPKGRDALVGELAGHLALAVLDLRDRKRHVSQTSQLENLLQSTLVLNSTLDLDPLLEVLMDIGVDLAGADAGALFLKEEGEGRLFFKVARGDASEVLQGVVLERGEGIAGWVAENGAAVEVADAREDPRFCSRVDDSLGQRTRAVVCVPLRTREEVIGSLEVIRNRSSEPFGPSTVVLLSSLASQAAIAIKNALLYKLAITDALTGLYSYRYFQDALHRETRLAEKNSSVLSLLLLDVDRFKSFNDSHGHELGDRVLQEIARVLRANTRETDVAARYGGEEMVMILRDTPKETAVAIAERIRSRIEELGVVGPDGDEVHVTASVGVGAYPTDTPLGDRLFYLVDSALFAAKQRGRNRVVAFREELLSENVRLG